MSMGIERTEETHKLNEDWTFWYDYQEKKQWMNQDNWSDSLQSLCKVSDVEHFWAAEEKIGNVKDLPVSSNIHFFREGIQPMWEDKRNIKGGKWILELTSSQNIHDIWINTLLLCISEFPLLRSIQMHNNQLLVNEALLDRNLEGVICGAVLSPRKNYIRISIWTNIKDERVVNIGKLWKLFASIPDTHKIIFKSHESAIKGSRDVVTDLYSL
ncbi:translation initiation factor 4E [Nematocida sp. LUAm3]|nr:translation initiation factor 4E [Nematocida sp. LUAm3]KAI5174705.1 translation initiation factor 4E [Nematocida sp. LUAm2]KAI5177884.1 translation initiation factor 4E [Nematocida sp. LUAm1]